MEKLTLDPQTQKAFETKLKIGIVKQLRQEGLLTGAQATELLSQILGPQTCGF